MGARALERPGESNAGAVGTREGTWFRVDGLCPFLPLKHTYPLSPQFFSQKMLITMCNTLIFKCWLKFLTSKQNELSFPLLILL